MKLSDITKLADTGGGALAIAANAVKLLERVATAVERIADHVTRDDLPACTSCEAIGTLLCSEHGVDGYRG